MFNALYNTITTYLPMDESEELNRETMLKFMQDNSDVLYRTNMLAHFVASAVVLNETKDKVLLVHHNIYCSWSLPGGHLDGDSDYIRVAEKETVEETGVTQIVPFTSRVDSLDILPVLSHTRKGQLVPTHLHFSITCIFTADESKTLQVNADENSAVAWFTLEEAGELLKGDVLLPILEKCLRRL